MRTSTLKFQVFTHFPRARLCLDLKALMVTLPVYILFFTNFTLLILIKTLGGAQGWNQLHLSHGKTDWEGWQSSIVTNSP